MLFLKKLLCPRWKAAELRLGHEGWGWGMLGAMQKAGNVVWLGICILCACLWQTGTWGKAGLEVMQVMGKLAKIYKCGGKWSACLGKVQRTRVCTMLWYCLFCSILQSSANCMPYLVWDCAVLSWHPSAPTRLAWGRLKTCVFSWAHEMPCMWGCVWMWHCSVWLPAGEEAEMASASSAAAEFSCWKVWTDILRNWFALTV